MGVLFISRNNKIEERPALTGVLLSARKQVVSARKQVVSARKQVVSARKQVVSARKQVVSARKQVVSARKQVVSSFELWRFCDECCNFFVYFVQ
ncbi:hypothetical protein [Bacillus sp. J14TS2]|uniref:hypothetical protein n=1 Tax=Bacillus sp. J14TS2 TaxID=2807188 RepID=UPI0035B562F2